LLKFILNNQEVTADKPGTLLLDFIRYQQHLTGTKIGCREGDCGACTVLIGELKPGQMQYRSFTSCLTPLGNVAGKHVVTVEGLNLTGLNAIQQAMVEESATQCGFCTPGFVVSLAGFCLSAQDPTPENALAAIDGNICRCTGYKSIERAARRVAELLQGRQQQDPGSYAAEKHLLPPYFTGIKERLQALVFQANGRNNGYENPASENIQMLAGGTDLYVQKPEELQEAAPRLLFDDAALKGIVKTGNRCYLGAAVTVTDLGESALLREYFPGLHRYLRLVSSTPIRNMATLAGNFVNASPIGDFTIIFLALNATLVLNDGENVREVPLRRFYHAYKVVDKKPQEYIRQMWFELPAPGVGFHFEKVSKRTHLDIASVNTAILLRMQDDVIGEIGLSAGGVGPVPAFLERTSAFLKGKAPEAAVLTAALDVAQSEIAPISDARGSAGYKRLLLNQLLRAHFRTLLPPSA
jgi:xanthine dehydrogenase small subunit